MNLKNRKPVFVPREHWAEMEKMTKAALMDLVWDMCHLRGQAENTSTLAQFRAARDVVEIYRDKVKDEAALDEQVAQ